LRLRHFGRFLKLGIGNLIFLDLISGTVIRENFLVILNVYSILALVLMTGTREKLLIILYIHVSPGHT
jgi:hypothetical protein